MYRKIIVIGQYVQVIVKDVMTFLRHRVVQVYSSSLHVRYLQESLANANVKRATAVHV